MIKESILLLSLCTSNFVISDNSSNVYVHYDCDGISLNSTTSNPFIRLGGFEKFKVLDCDDGYVYYSHEVFSTQFTNNSSLYIAHFVTEFTPGSVARKNGDTKYKDYFLDEGYVHVTLEKYVDGDSHGGDIVVKDYWPKSSSFTTTITSSFGASSSFSSGFNFGIEFGNGATFKVDSTNSSALNLSFNYSKSTVVPDPILSTQLSSSNNLEVQYSYNVNNVDPCGMSTYLLDTYVLFEMKDNYYNANKDAFYATYKVQIKNCYRIMFNWFAQGWDFSSSVRIGEFI